MQKKNTDTSICSDENVHKCKINFCVHVLPLSGLCMSIFPHGNAKVFHAHVKVFVHTSTQLHILLALLDS